MDAPVVDEPVVEETPPPLKPPAPPTLATSLEAVELELSLEQRNLSDEEFEAALRETVKSFGAVLLFNMKLQDEEGGRWAAAIALDDGEAREIAILELPCNGGSASVRPASESEQPIAAIASAYAGLAECWGKAA